MTRKRLRHAQIVAKPSTRMEILFERERKSIRCGHNSLDLDNEQNFISCMKCGSLVTIPDSITTITQTYFKPSSLENPTHVHPQLLYKNMLRYESEH